ncbi:hypothetical protein [Streptomyces sp. BPTC-684]|uniref:hypothetical protein n=1 Tax=Streptomyces sp. BPTC-684 TaxID=3043734 RepID=UPI0024B07743|nr:hypothetical protein [Streptomyces sp. BPTC-684]WHM40959.1 hypothetical protein QIY60_31525 [Streptomyces sp. BPTC-684]
MAVLDYGLSQRALIAVSTRSGDVAELLPADSPRSPTAAPRRSISRPCGAAVRQAVRAAPSRPHRPADPTDAALHRVTDGLAASTHALGELMLEVAPAYLSDTDAADVLTR